MFFKAFDFLITPDYTRSPDYFKKFLGRFLKVTRESCLSIETYTVLYCYSY